MSGAVDHGDVDGPRLSLGKWEGDGYVGVKGAGAGGARGADESRAELALEEILNETVVPLEVGGQDFSRHLFIWSTQCVLCVHVCVRERERERESSLVGETSLPSHPQCQ